jgi:hypothetical protein
VVEIITLTLNKMRVRTKKGIVDVTKSFDDLSKSVIRLGNTANGTAIAFRELAHSNYLLWKSTFKPQSQRVINVIIITGLVLALAEIVWFVVTKY